MARTSNARAVKPHNNGRQPDSAAPALSFHEDIPDPAAIKLVPRAVAEKHLILPVAIDGDALTIATTDPDDVFVLDEIARQAGRRVTAVRAAEHDIRAGIVRGYGHVEAVKYAPTGSPEADHEPPAEAAVSAFTDTAPAIHTIDEIIRQAVRERTSDVHLEPQEHHLYVRFRVDGVMYDWVKLSLDMHPAMVSRIKIMSRLNISEKRLPQDGRFNVTTGDDAYDVRVSVIPTTMGEKVVLRFLPKTQGVLELEQLGLDPAAFAAVQRELERSYGMMLVTGPTGSGKTTSLYAALNRINCESKNVVTIEDPVEYEFPRVSQIQVYPKIGLNFADGLRHILRQDPDVLMIGEIRDGETLHMAIRSALTGHMVFSTVHCNDAASTPARLVDMGAEPFLLASCLTTVVAQRLARRICDNCKEEFRPSDAVFEALGLDPDMGTVHRGVGCERCRNTGHYGRVALFEVMPVTDGIRDAILQGDPASGIRQLARESGVRSLRQDGIGKAFSGITSLEEVLRVTQLE